VFGKVDIITGTLGKALGGGCGGFTSGKRELVQVLRQRSRPYLFSNSLAPAIVGAALKALDLIEADTSLRDRLEENTRYFRAGLIARDFVLRPGEHPIIPVMLHDAGLTQRFAHRLLELGVFVTGFVHPVVAEGQARIRVQVSAQHTLEQIDDALAAFAQVRREMAL
jgi:glycine C-acetyltransferase